MAGEGAAETTRICPSCTRIPRRVTAGPTRCNLDCLMTDWAEMSPRRLTVIPPPLSLSLDLSSQSRDTHVHRLIAVWTTQTFKSSDTLQSRNTWPLRYLREIDHEYSALHWETVWYAKIHPHLGAKFGGFPSYHTRRQTLYHGYILKPHWLAWDRTQASEVGQETPPWGESVSDRDWARIRKGSGSSHTDDLLKN